MGKLVFEEFVLEEVDLKNIQHKLFIEKLMKDKSIQRELFIDKEQFMNDNSNRSELLSNNSFVVSVDDILVGYIETGPISKESISLAIGIEKSFRNNGYGELIISSLTDYLLDRDDISNVSVVISNKNLASIRLFEKCGFKKREDIPYCYEKQKTIDLSHKQSL